MSRPRTQFARGFTLVELMVVMLIIAILAAIAIPAYVASIRAAREALAEHGGRLLLTGAHPGVERALNAAGLCVSGSSVVCESLEDALKTLKGSAR